jgi:acetyl-CoA C-acetyltransferase
MENMMKDVWISGIGQTEVGEHWDLSIRELALHAIEAAVQDAGGLAPQALYVGNMLAPALSRQTHLATLIADFAGLSGVEAVTVEASGASGGAAFRQAALAVQSGAVETALVLGVEKITDQVGPVVSAALATALDADYESEQGMTPTAQAALLMQRYLYEYNPPREAFGAFPITAHANGATNPYAMFRSAIKPETYNRAGMVAPPLNMFDAAPDADGAAAILLSRGGAGSPGNGRVPVRVAGSSLVTDTLALHDRPDPLDFRAVRLSAERALRQAGRALGEVDFFELYDAYSIYAALALEAAGFADKGTGWAFPNGNGITREGRLPVATFGGLKARGNPGGATGVYQLVESALQLRGDAGHNQVAGAKVGLVQSLGGPASTVVTHVLERI